MSDDIPCRDQNLVEVWLTCMTTPISKLQWTCRPILTKVKKMSSDSEQNSFANLLRSSDEDIMEDEEGDVEESQTHKLKSCVDLMSHFGCVIQMPFLKAKYM